MQDLEKLLHRLSDAGIDYVVVGGFAAVAHGGADVTRDVDVCMAFNEANLLKLQSALAGLNPKHRMTMHDAPLELPPEKMGWWRNLYLRTDLGVIDCLSEVLGVGGFEEVRAHSTAMDFSFGTCRVLDIDTLIQAKLAMGRPHDLRTAQQLRALRDANRSIQ